MRKEERRRKTPPENPTPTAANDAEKLKKICITSFCRHDTSYRGGTTLSGAAIQTGYLQEQHRLQQIEYLQEQHTLMPDGVTFRSIKGSSR
jgi:hypothetical protein